MRKINRRGAGNMAYALLGIVIVIIAVGVGVALYYQSLPPPVTNLPAATITSGGASFPYPLISVWTSTFNNLYPQVKITYQSVGSGAGQNGLFAKTFDFAGSDSPLSNTQLANYSVVHIPETVGGVVIAYNLPGISSGLNLTANVIAQIFQGNITQWNDPRIAALNPGFTLPSTAITVVHRQDSSGTTDIFTSYLTNASSVWVLGHGKSINWPTGTAGPQNSGVASILHQTPGSVGYLEFFYAANASITFGNVQNQAGQFVTPSLTTIANAANAGAPLLTNDIRSPIFNLQGDNVYPISAFTYLLVYKDLTYLGNAKASDVANFIWWAIHSGQQYGASLYYPALPSSVVALGENTIQSLVYNGSTIPIIIK